MRLVDADALLANRQILRGKDVIGIRDYVTVAEIENAPTIEPERETGKWIYGEDNPGTGRDGWFCDQCGHFEFWDYSSDMKSAELNLPNFCPNCGANMMG